LRFPVLVKPLTRGQERWEAVADAKAIHVESEAELSLLPARLADNVGGVLIQEAIAGPESSIESYHVYIDASGEIVGEFTGRKLRTHPPRYGYSTAVVITDSQEVTALGREISRRLDLRGWRSSTSSAVTMVAFTYSRSTPASTCGTTPERSPVSTCRLLCSATWQGSRDRHRPARGRGVRWCSAHDLQAARS
jgi:hypothetical protein